MKKFTTYIAIATTALTLGCAQTPRYTIYDKPEFIDDQKCYGERLDEIVKDNKVTGDELKELLDMAKNPKYHAYKDNKKAEDLFYTALGKLELKVFPGITVYTPDNKVRNAGLTREVESRYGSGKKHLTYFDLREIYGPEIAAQALFKMQPDEKDSCTSDSPEEFVEKRIHIPIELVNTAFGTKFIDAENADKLKVGGITGLKPRTASICIKGKGVILSENTGKAEKKHKK